MTPAEAAFLAAAGLGAGVVNGVAGGGSMVSFPALLAAGYPALTANVTSTVGIWPGYLGSAAGFKGVLDGAGAQVRSLALVSAVGAVAGVALLLVLPASSFRTVVPYLILFACALFAAQPLLARRLRARAGTGTRHRLALQGAVFLAAVYGGYFGAGVGVVLMAVLGLMLPGTLVRISGLRSVLTLLINTVAAALFVVGAPVAWAAVAVMAAPSLLGGYLGAHLSRRLPAPVLRGAVIAFGLAAALKLLAG